MPRKRGGGRHRSKRKGNLGNKRELVYREEGQEYAQCLKLLGSGRMRVYCFDGKERMAKIRGKFKRRVWVNLGDVVLVQKREFTTDDENCDVVHVYYSDEVKKLKNFGELPNDLKVTEKSNDDKGNLNIEFGDEEEGENVQEKKQKKQKSNWEDLMPSGSSDEDEEEEEEQQQQTTDNKQKTQDNNKTQKKVKFEPQVKEESDSESEKEKDELDDI